MLLLFRNTLCRNRPIQKDLPTAPRLRFLPADKTFCYLSGLKKKLVYCPPFAWVDIIDERENLILIFKSLAMPDRNDYHRLHSVGWILPVPLVVAFAPASEYHFQDFDEHPQSQYCNDYVSHITDLFLITTCKDTKKSRHRRIYNVKYQCNMWLFQFLPIRFELGLQETYNFRKSQFLLEFKFLDKRVPSCV